VGEFVALLVSDKQGGMGWMTGSDVVIDGGE
jgi:sorbose reductase